MCNVFVYVELFFGAKIHIRQFNDGVQEFMEMVVWLLHFSLCVTVVRVRMQKTAHLYSVCRDMIGKRLTGWLVEVKFDCFNILSNALHIGIGHFLSV